MSEDKGKKMLRVDAYSRAEEFCLEKYPLVRECMDLTNMDLDLKTCRPRIKQFEECFNHIKKAAFANMARDQK